MIAVPGPRKDLPAFQRDDAICWSQAAAHTGYSGLAQPGAAAGSGGAAANAPAAASRKPPATFDSGQIGYLRCMAARGDTVSQDASGYAAVAGADPYGYL
jgi:hypothetical protein